jgi:hypothetical protein
MTEESDDSKNNVFTSSNSDCANKNPSSGSIDDWSRAVVDGSDRLCCDGSVRDPQGSRTLVAASESRFRVSAESPDKAGTNTEAKEHYAPVLSQVPKRATKAKAKACVRGKEVYEVVTFRGSPPPEPHVKWVGQQDATEIPNGGRLLEAPPGFPDRLLVIEDDQRRRRIIVLLKQRERLHLSLLHVGSEGDASADQALLLAQDERSHQRDRHVVPRLSSQQDAFVEAQPRVR